MTKIGSFEEYNEFRRGKRRWHEPIFDMPRSGENICGLCGYTFQSSEYFFLICKSCISGKVEMNRTKPYTDVVYGLYSMNDELLYIGVTNNPINRAHNHMLTKNFKTLRVIRYFQNRQAADDFEKYAISHIRPVLNRKIDTDWSEVPSDFDTAEFGNLAKPIKVKSGKRKNKGQKNKGVKAQTPKQPVKFCANCQKPMRRSNIVVNAEGQEVHKRACSAPPTAEEKQAVREKIANHNKRARRHNKRSQGVPSSGPKCKYCFKSLDAGAHMVCRRKRLKELGLL